MMNSPILLVLLLTVCLANSDPEYAEHGSPNKNSEKKHGHNSDDDHQAVLGLFLFLAYILAAITRIEKNGTRIR